MKRILLMTCIMAAVFSLSCGGGSDSDSSQNVRVLLTDAPAENLKSVFVTISNVRVHGSAGADEGEAGWEDITVTAEMPVDLLTLEGGVVKALGSENLDPGHYQQICQQELKMSTFPESKMSAFQEYGFLGGGEDLSLPCYLSADTTSFCLS
jgi:hypothetical protein